MSANGAATSTEKSTELLQSTIRKPFVHGAQSSGRDAIATHRRCWRCLSESCIRLILLQPTNDDDDDDDSYGSAIAVELRINGESLSCRSAYYLRKSACFLHARGACVQLCLCCSIVASAQCKFLRLRLIDEFNEKWSSDLLWQNAWSGAHMVGFIVVRLPTVTEQ